jgi:hypothetical protein
MAVRPVKAAPFSEVASAGDLPSACSGAGGFRSRDRLYLSPILQRELVLVVETEAPADDARLDGVAR